MHREKCFFVAPIGDKDTPIRKRFELISNMLRDLCNQYDINLELASILDESANGDINDDILRHLREDYFCVIDLTGLNPNVMYELGIRVQCGKEYVTFAEEATKLPFDIKTKRTHFCGDLTVEEQLNKFKNELKTAIIETLKEYKPESPLIKRTIDDVRNLLPKTRYNQSISFIITDYTDPSGDKYLRFSCLHAYELRKESDEIVNIDMFNDISIPMEINDKLPENDKTQFNSVTMLSDARYFDIYKRTDSECKSKFYFDEYGRPHFKTEGVTYGEAGNLTLISFI